MGSPGYNVRFFFMINIVSFSFQTKSFLAFSSFIYHNYKPNYYRLTSAPIIYFLYRTRFKALLLWVCILMHIRAHEEWMSPLISWSLSLASARLTRWCIISGSSRSIGTYLAIYTVSIKTLSTRPYNLFINWTSPDDKI